MLFSHPLRFKKKIQNFETSLGIKSYFEGNFTFFLILALIVFSSRNNLERIILNPRMFFAIIVK